MLKAIRDGHNWKILFLLISLEKTDVFLRDIDFPSEINPGAIRPIARDFAEQYHSNIVPVHYHVQRKNDSQQLLDNIYFQLSGVLGEQRATKFADWGNHFLLDTDIERSIQIIWRVMSYQAGEDAALDLTELGMQALLSIIKHYSTRYSSLLMAVEKAEAQPKNVWEERAIWIYNGGTVYTPNINDFTHPFDYILTLFDLLEIPPLFKSIKQTLQQDDFDALNQWLKAKHQAKNYKSPYQDLDEILAQV